jgi:hypothetical protein
MKYYRLIIFLSGLLLSGCNNTVGNMEIKGKVIDESTKAPIPNISVMIEAIYQSNDSTSNIYAGDFTTDSLGCFAYTLKKVKSTSLYSFCIEGHPAYAESNELLGLSDLDSYGKFLSFEVNRIVDLTLKINRVSKTPFRDTLTVTWKTNGVDGLTLYPFKIENYRINSENGLKWIGGDVKSAIKTKVYADKNTIVHWKLIRNGRHKDIIDTIFCMRDAYNSVYFTY